MSENISLKMGVNFAASLNMGKNLCWVLYIITYKRRPSKWVHIQTLNTHIRAFLYWSRPPGSEPNIKSMNSSNWYPVRRQKTICLCFMSPEESRYQTCLV